MAPKPLERNMIQSALAKCCIIIVIQIVKIRDSKIIQNKFRLSKEITGNGQ